MATVKKNTRTEEVEKVITETKEVVTGYTLTLDEDEVQTLYQLTGSVWVPGGRSPYKRHTDDIWNALYGAGIRCFDTKDRFKGTIQAMPS